MAGSSFEESVRAVLSDTMNLPQDFLNYLIQNQALNPIPIAKTSGQKIASGTATSNVSTSGTTFAGGVDLLGSALEFTATGSSSYIVRVFAVACANSAAGDEVVFHINLDGADDGIFFDIDSPPSGGGFLMPCAAAGRFTPSAGDHSLNVRLHSTGAGTATVYGGSGGLGANTPILVTLEVA